MNLEMGLSTKQVSGDWSHSFLPELPKPFPARRQAQQQQEQLKCPRCDSSNTKFCYYNNYNKSQPRHFCKACKRHWTKGGTLRNVPVGGGRKTKRAKRSNSVDSKKNHTRLESQNFVLPMDGQKNNSDTFYQSFIRPTSLLPDCSMNGFGDKIFIGNSCNFLPVNQNQVPQFSSSSLSSFDAYNSTKKLEEVMEDPINSIVCDEPWQLVPSTSSAMEVPNYWNWGDLETMVSADLNIAWDDTGVES